jgi:hypothetical protein
MLKNNLTGFPSHRVGSHVQWWSRSFCSGHAWSTLHIIIDFRSSSRVSDFGRWHGTLPSTAGNQDALFGFGDGSWCSTLCSMRGLDSLRRRAPSGLQLLSLLVCSFVLVYEDFDDQDACLVFSLFACVCCCVVSWSPIILYVWHL